MLYWSTNHFFFSNENFTCDDIKKSFQESSQIFSLPSLLVFNLFICESQNFLFLLPVHSKRLSQMCLNRTPAKVSVVVVIRMCRQHSLAVYKFLCLTIAFYCSGVVCCKQIRRADCVSDDWVLSCVLWISNNNFDSSCTPTNLFHFVLITHFHINHLKFQHGSISRRFILNLSFSYGERRSYSQYWMMKLNSMLTQSSFYFIFLIKVVIKWGTFFSVPIKSILSQVQRGNCN